MQRNYRSEVITAVVALVVLVLVVGFAVLLSDEGGTPSSATDVAQSVATSTATNMLPPTGTATTVTEAVANTDIPVTTAAPTREVTDTPTPPATDTPEPTATMPPSATVTPTSEPTATPDPTATPAPTHTPTARPTQTSSPTRVLQPVADLGIVPTLPASPTPPPTDSPTREPADCERPRGWTTYEVQPGNTLFAIALATRSTLDDLRYANCIEDVDTIEAEQVLFVPREPVEPVATLVPSGVRRGLASVGCRDSRTQITNPSSAERLMGVFTVYGTATREDFWYYKIEIRPDNAEIYNFYLDSYQPVENGIIGQVNADIFGDGLHWLRLSVVNIRAEIPPDATCEIPVIFE